MLEIRVENMGPKYGVMVIDMQPHYLKYVCESDREIIISAQREVLETCIQREIPVFVFELGKRSETLDELKGLVEKNPYPKFLNKCGKDCFSTSNIGKDKLNYLLRKKFVNSICLTGIYASQCILATAEEAKKEGFNIITADQLIAEQEGFNEKFRVKSFFNSNGTYFDNHKDLLDLLKK